MLESQHPGERWIPMDRPEADASGEAAATAGHGQQGHGLAGAPVGTRDEGRDIRSRDVATGLGLGERLGG